MKINRDNYEQYFLDHAEGNLSPEMESELAEFLEANPDLGGLLENYDASPVPPSLIRNDNLKKRLKKNIHVTAHIGETNIDEWLIRETEGHLTPGEEAELQDFLVKNPAFEFDRRMVGLTYLKPDLTVTFPGKGRLKKKAPIVAVPGIYWIVSAVAAVILLLIGIRIFREPAMDIVLPAAVPEKEVVAEVSKPIGTPSRESGTPSPGTASRGTSSRFNETPSQLLSPVKATAIHSETTHTALAFTNTYYIASPIRVSEKQEKSLVAGMFGKLAVKARNAFRNNEKVEKIRNTDLDIWSIARAGVNGFNKMSDRDIELLVRKNDDGSVKSYAFVEDDKILLARERNKE